MQWVAVSKEQGEPGDDTAPLYDSITDAICIYHNYQLLIVTSENAGGRACDEWRYQTGTVWCGQFRLCGKPARGEERTDDDKYLTYAPTHTYVLSKNFTEQMPEMVASMVTNGTVNPEQLGARIT